jgi:diaminopimelate epimerase
MRFSKWHALGNTYLVAEPDDGGPLTEGVVRERCRDADGVVEIIGAGKDEVDVVIWNADGSTAEMSGNGTRIAARWLAERTGAESVRVRVGEREVVARMLGGADAETDMGEVAVGERELVAGVDLVVVSIGNPHAIVQGDPDDVERLGPLLATHARFPAGVNVEIARVDGPGEVTARVWERGVGETSASGTGAVAVAAATHRDGEVTVRFPGGPLRVRLDQGRAYLTGPAAPVSRSEDAA